MKRGGGEKMYVLQYDSTVTVALGHLLLRTSDWRDYDEVVSPPMDLSEPLTGKLCIGQGHIVIPHPFGPHQDEAIETVPLGT